MEQSSSSYLFFYRSQCHLYWSRRMNKRIRLDHTDKTVFCISNLIRTLEFCLQHSDRRKCIPCVVAWSLNLHLQRIARPALRVVGAGFNFSVEFRRNFGVFFVFTSYREEKFRYFSPFFVFKFKNLKIFIKNSKKYDKKLGVLLSK